MKHIQSIILSFVSLLCAAQGVRADDIIITTTDELNAIATAVNSGTDYSGTTIKLANDLDYTDKTYTPIGSVSAYGYPFKGVFDGQGHTISGVSLSGGNRKALFNHVRGTGTIKNLTLSNSTISSDDAICAGIVALLDEGGSVENCHVTSDVTVGPGKTAQGGIVGKCTSGNITACTSAATLRNGTNTSSTIKNGVGGIIGFAGEANPSSVITANISKCLYYGTSIDMSGYSGAVIGLMSTSSSNSNVNLVSNFYIVPEESTTHGVGRKDFLFGGNENNKQNKDDYDEGSLPESISVVHTNGAVRVHRVSDLADIADMGTVVDSYSNGITAYSDEPSNAARPCSGVRFGDTYYSHILSLDDNATGTTNSALLAALNGKMFDVKLRDRTFYRDGDWNTFCLPFSLSNLHGTIFNSEVYAGADIKELDNTHFYYIEKSGHELAYRTGCQDGKLYLFFRDVGSGDIQAGKPYIVKWSNTHGEGAYNPAWDHVDPVFRNVTINNTKHDVTSRDETVTYTPVYDIFSRDYKDLTVLILGAASTLYYPGGTGTVNVKPCRAYFQLNGVQMKDGSTDTGEDDDVYIEGGADVKAFVVDIEGDATCVETLKNNQIQDISKSGGCYTLDGRHIDGNRLKLNGSGLKSGIYIVNGKKLLVK